MSVPIVYMWLVHFEDGQIMPQFDIETGEENRYKQAMEYPAQITKIGWYPIPPQFAHQIKTDVLVKSLPQYEMQLSNGVVPVILRRNYIDYNFTGIQNRRLIYILGWQKNEEYCVMFIDDEGNVELTNNFEHK